MQNTVSIVNGLTYLFGPCGHYNPLLNTNHTLGQNFVKKKTPLAFKNGEINIRAKGFNGVCLVLTYICLLKNLNSYIREFQKLKKQFQTIS